MKNKLLNYFAFVLLFFQVPLLAQSPEPAAEPEKKERLEQRQQQSNEKQAPAAREKANRQGRPYSGGKQNFRGNSFQEKDFRQPGFRFHRFNGRGYGPGRLGYNFQRHGFRTSPFRPHRFHMEQFRYREFNQRGYRNLNPQTRRFRPAPGQLNKKQHLELKNLKEQIWKDGSMDLKEREALRNKTRDLQRLNHRSFQGGTGEHKK